MNDWQPSASIENIQRRAKLLATIRQFFCDRNVMEVQTPILGTAPNPEPNLVNFITTYTQPGSENPRTLYLQTSPEFHMKRLLAAGSGSIYQIIPVFRNEEAGRYHNPEFTMLEWYRVDFNCQQLMDEVDLLLQTVLKSKPATRITYQTIFKELVELDPLTCTQQDAANVLTQSGVQLHSPIASLDEGLQLLMTHIIEPQLGDRVVMIHDFPASQAMLAELKKDDPRVAERFEVYCNGVELANGFQELRDPILQRERFETQNAARKETVVLDERLLAALPHMPQSSGVALGLDRLLQIQNGGTLADNIAFAIDVV